MRLSSPKLNYLIGVGALLLYISIILVVIPIHEGNRELATSLCITTAWLTSVGYSLCYGTILVKMFRIWYIFNKPLQKKRKVAILDICVFVSDKGVCVMDAVVLTTVEPLIRDTLR